MRDFGAYRARPSTGGVLPVGRHIVEIIEMRSITDRTDWSTGEEKPADQLPVWKDATPQMGVLFRKEGEGTFIHRFNGAGYLRYVDIDAYNAKVKDGTYAKLGAQLGFTEEEMAGWVQIDKSKYIPEGDEGYAMHKETFTRVEDPEMTEKALRFLDQLVHDCGLPEGSELTDCKGHQVGVQIREKMYNGNSHLEVRRTFKPTEATKSETKDIFAD